MRIVSAAEALSAVQSGNRVFIHSVAAAPRRLIEALTARSGELRVVEIVQLHTEGEAPYAAPGVSRSFRVNSVFVGPNLRDAVQEGRADYLPVFLSEVPKLFRSGLLPLDVALVQVSPPDRHGFCSLGVSVDCTRAAVQSARTVIASISRRGAAATLWMNTRAPDLMTLTASSADTIRLMRRAPPPPRCGRTRARS